MMPLQQRSALRLVYWGAMLTAVAVPLLSLALRTNLVMAPLVVLDAGAVTVRIFWRWRNGPYRTAVLAAIGERGEVASMIVGLVAGAIGTVGVAFLTAFASAHLNVSPCLCGPLYSLRFLLGSAVTAGGFAFIESAALLAVVLAITKLAYDARR